MVATLDQIVTFRARHAANDDGVFVLVLVVDRHDTRNADELYEPMVPHWLDQKEFVSRDGVHPGSYERAHVLARNTDTV